jgi:hypothetical protein
MSFLEEVLLPRLDARSTTLPSGCHEWNGMVDSMGYPKIKLAPYWPKGARASRMILAMTLDRLPTEYEWVCHSCGNKLCVNVDHIYCGNALTNNRDTVEHGHRINGHGKTDASTRRKIKMEYEAGCVTQSDLADKYGVNQPRISQIIRSGGD